MSEKNKFKEQILRRLDSITIHSNWTINNYNDLDLFLIHLNSSIQEIRNITFLLQSNKWLYEKFDEWYWKKQEEMKLDLKLRWVVDSRNKIVKQEDLEVYSIAKINLVNWDNYNLPVIELPPRMSNDELKNLFYWIASFKWLKILSDSIYAPLLIIERFWIDKDFKDEEIIFILNYSFQYFKKLIVEFLLLLWLDVDYDKNIDISNLSNQRKVLFDIKNDSELKFEYKNFSEINIPNEIQNKAIDLFSKVENSRIWNMIDDFLIDRLNFAKIIIEEWEEHLPWCFFLDSNLNIIDTRVWMFENRTQKYAFIREMLEIVNSNNNINGIVLVWEVWMVPVEKWNEHFDNENSSTWKKEALSINFIDKSLNIKHLSCTFDRSKEKVTFEEFILEEVSIDRLWILKPIYELWSISK